MKRDLLVLTAAIGLATLTGCACTHGTGVTGMIRGSCARAPELCASCDECDGCGECVAAAPACHADRGCHDGPLCGGGWRHLLGVCRCGDPGCHRGHAGRGVPAVTQPGPPVGQVAYPYYRNRGPRDFLMSEPRPLGP